MRNGEKHANMFCVSAHIYLRECIKIWGIHKELFHKGNRFSGSSKHVKLIKFHELLISIFSSPNHKTDFHSAMESYSLSQSNHRYEIKHTLMLFPHQYPPFGNFRVWKCFWCLEKKISFLQGGVYIWLLLNILSYPMLTSSTNGAGWVTALRSNH